MANNIETQDIFILEKLRAVAESIERLQMLARIVDPAADARTFGDYYCLQNEFIDKISLEHENLRLALTEHVLPFVRDFKAMRTR